jgi:catechol 2,3-dioxygenase-like lactoylglutathione lyase family enzyme
VFDHVTIRVSDRAASERPYATVLAALGIHQSSAGERHAGYYAAYVLDPDGNDVEVVSHNHG